MSFDQTPVRQALDYLLDAYPTFDLVSIDWQWSDELGVEHGPWVLVKLGQPSQGETLAWAIWPFAIWKTTGALHRFEGEGDEYPGAVSDDPIWTP